MSLQSITVKPTFHPTSKNKDNSLHKCIEEMDIVFRICFKGLHHILWKLFRFRLHICYSNTSPEHSWWHHTSGCCIFLLYPHLKHGGMMTNMRCFCDWLLNDFLIKWSTSSWLHKNIEADGWMFYFSLFKKCLTVLKDNICKQNRRT